MRTHEQKKEGISHSGFSNVLSYSNVLSCSCLLSPHTLLRNSIPVSFEVILLLSVSKFSLMSNTFLYQWPQLICVLYQDYLLCSERDASLFSVITPEQSWKAISSLHTLQLHCYLCKIAMSQLYRSFYHE